MLSLMKTTYLVANWKSHKTTNEATEWLQTIAKDLPAISTLSEKKIIVCPPFPYLPTLKSYINDHALPIVLGAQNVSPFEEGAYTGEVNARQVKEFAEFVIIGHSERRREFSESDDLLGKKVKQAQGVGLTVIFCVQGEKIAIPNGVSIVAYEPSFAIGTGTPDTPENASAVCEYLKREKHIETVLYGGSVTGKDVHMFTKMPSIDGVLVGKACLDPASFSTIISHA